jgi:hypothetical protein
MLPALRDSGNAPLLWKQFCTEYLRLSPRETDTFWAALGRSTGSHQSRGSWWDMQPQDPASRPSRIRTAMVYAAAQRPTFSLWRHTLEGMLSPSLLVLALEDLVQERLLTRYGATTLEERVFRRTDAHGAWM